MSEVVEEFDEEFFITPSPTEVDNIGRTVLAFDNVNLKPYLVTPHNDEVPVQTFEPEVQQRAYIHFHFNLNRLIGTPLLPANEGSRLGAVIHAIANQANEYRTLTDVGAKKRFSAFKAYLNSELTINSEKSTRGEIYNIDLAILKLEAILSSYNEASWQAIQQLPKLEPHILRTIKLILYSSLHQETLKQIYDQRFAELKKNNEDKKD